MVYAAHCTCKSGVLAEKKNNIWQNDLLRVAQIAATVKDLDGINDGFYSKVLKNQADGYRRDKPIALINAKDIEKPEDLEDKSASCLIKMTHPTFNSFVMAFQDAESRVRLNYDLPDGKYSIIRSIQWRGAGFFSETGIAFSQNLNAIIGGRGTGKSTLIESIRFALDLPKYGQEEKTLRQLRESNLANSEVTLEIRSKVQNGCSYKIRRRSGEARSVVTDINGKHVPYLQPSDILQDIEILGQNEILAIEQNDAAKRALIDRFLSDKDSYEEKIHEINRQLQRNREQLLNAIRDHEDLDAKVSKEGVLRDRLAQYDKFEFGPKGENYELLSKEKSLQRKIGEKMIAIESWLSGHQKLFDLSFFQNAEYQSLPNKDYVDASRKILAEFQDKFDSLMQTANRYFTEARSGYDGLAERWNKECDKIQEILNAVIAKLPDQGGRNHREVLAEYTAIRERLEEIEQLRKSHEDGESHVNAIRSKRDQLLEQYRDFSFSRYDSMEREIRRVNKRLFPKVKISVIRMGDISKLREFLLSLDGIGESKVKFLDDISTDLDLVQWARWSEEKDAKTFVEKYGKFGLTKGVADRLCSLNSEMRLKLEEIRLNDNIRIELNVSDDTGEPHFEPLERLSTGQKCTAILNLLLLDRDTPLIIDQPEDNLDNAFIADRIVRDLRSFKNRRQLLFATHNPNIPIFGDAELIVVLEAEARRGRISDEGSIDKPSVREKAAKILEGGKAAFRMRKEKYGF